MIDDKTSQDEPSTEQKQDASDQQKATGTRKPRAAAKVKPASTADASPDQALTDSASSEEDPLSIDEDPFESEDEAALLPALINGLPEEQRKQLTELVESLTIDVEKLKTISIPPTEPYQISDGVNEHMRLINRAEAMIQGSLELLKAASLSTDPEVAFTYALKAACIKQSLIVVRNAASNQALAAQART